MKRKNIFLIIFCFLVTLMSLLTIAPSRMNYKGEGYCVKNALTHLQVISEKPHSVTDYENHEEVRKYLINSLGGLLGSENVQERNYLTKSNSNPTNGIEYVNMANPNQYFDEENNDPTYDIRNILGKLPGKSDKGILLVSHYDSRGNIKREGELAHSYGAADDGYGVVTILEMLRYIIDSNIELENSIYVLFTDAEETGMYGSRLESLNEELMNNVNFVINIEARGMNGATYMFETSKNNKKVIDLYNSSKAKVSYSIAPAVYSIMTNFTDFTNFLKVGKAGLNFTTLNNIEDYHVPSDNYQNVNPASLQHYGEHILPIVLEYVSDSKYSASNYFEASSDSVFFNLFPGVFVSYSGAFAIALSLIILLGFIAYLAIEIINKRFNYKKFFKKLGIVTLGFIIPVIISQFVSLYIARLNGYHWNLTNVRFEGSSLVTFLYLLISYLVVVYFTKKTNKEEDDNKYLLISALAINVLLLTLTSFVLQGASFVFLFPALLGTIYLLTSYLNNKIIKKTIFYLSLLILISLFVPLMASLLYALTIGGLLAFTLLTFIPFQVLTPQLIENI